MNGVKEKGKKGPRPSSRGIDLSDPNKITPENRQRLAKLLQQSNHNKFKRFIRSNRAGRYYLIDNNGTPELLLFNRPILRRFASLSTEGPRKVIWQVITEKKGGFLGEGQFGKVKKSNYYLMLDEANEDGLIIVNQEMVAKFMKSPKPVSRGPYGMSRRKPSIDIPQLHFEASLFSRLSKINEENVSQVRPVESDELTRSELISRHRGVDGPKYVIFQDFVKGEELEEVLYGDKAYIHQLSFDDRLDIAISMCKSLSYLHRLGYVHGDLKTENVIVNKQTLANKHEAKLIDVGLSRKIGAARTGITGTLLYIGPNDQNTYQTSKDIWALAGVLLQLFRVDQAYYQRFNKKSRLNLPGDTKSVFYYKEKANQLLPGHLNSSPYNLAGLLRLNYQGADSKRNAELNGLICHMIEPATKDRVDLLSVIKALENLKNNVPNPEYSKPMGPHFLSYAGKVRVLNEKISQAEARRRAVQQAMRNMMKRRLPPPWGQVKERSHLVGQILIVSSRFA